MTTAQDVQEAIDQADTEHGWPTYTKHALRMLAARIEVVDGRHEVGPALNDLADRIAKLEGKTAPPRFTVPAGFMAVPFAEAASLGGWTLGYHEDVGEFVLRKTIDGDAHGLIWLAPIPQPDPEKLAQALAEVLNVRRGRKVTDTHSVAEVRVALERCR